MNFNIDSAIFISFLVFNLAVGLFYSRGIKNIKEYAIGNRGFSTGAISATIAATWIGGGVLSQTITETYKNGLYFIIPALGDSLVLLVIGYFLAPRMGEFLGDLSIAESMNKLYGKTVKLITAFIAVMSCMGAIAAQFKVSAVILQLLFDVSSFYGVLAAAVIVVIYSSIGGIKAVTFTDIIQIFTFAVVIPIVSLIIWGTLDDSEHVLEKLITNPTFDYKQVFDIYNPRFFDSLLLFLFFIIPTLEPAIFQRINMARDTSQVYKSFTIAAFICLLISLIIAWIGVLLWAKNPDLNPNNLLAHIINDYSYPGLKGIIAIGVMAIIMSTADSYINSAAVLIANDIFSFKFGNSRGTGLVLPRVIAVIVAIISFFLAFNTKSLLDLTFLIWGSYMPIITVPLILAILGFRSTPRAVLIGMAAGVITMAAFKFFDIQIKAVIPAMVSNAFCFFTAHYILGEQGGWVGIKKLEPLLAVRSERKRKMRKLMKAIQEFNFWSFCKKNTPKHDYIYPLFGLFCIISVFSTMYSMPKSIQLEHKEILEFIYHTVLVSSSILLTFPIWPPTFKQEKFIVIAWNLILPYVLIFAPTLLIIVSNFGQFQLMIFILNIIIIALLLRWQVAIFMVCSTVFLSVETYKWHMGVDDLSAAIEVGLQFKIMYVLLLVSSILIVFFKPKQQYQDFTEEKNEHLSKRIETREKEVEEALALKTEFIRNMNHEYHAPMTGVISMAETLQAGYDKLTDDQKKQAIDVIVKSAHNLKVFDENLATLSDLSKPRYKLQKENFNFSDLVYERVETCRKLYDENKEDREFILNVEENIGINADRNYIIQLLDNLIINTISYCKKGLINISLNQERNHIRLSLSDEGIGIPKEELYEVFEPFTVSSITRTPAGGRGVGLAVCKRILEVHGGTIKAESDGKKGATFTVILLV
jgi:Na+/proline symporter/signal transduction histidine kinase